MGVFDALSAAFNRFVRSLGRPLPQRRGETPQPVTTSNPQRSQDAFPDGFKASLIVRTGLAAVWNALPGDEERIDFLIKIRPQLAELYGRSEEELTPERLWALTELPLNASMLNQLHTRFAASGSPPLSPDMRAAVSKRAEQSIDQALAMLFIRLGPPPEMTGADCVPVSNSGGGIQQ
ncbi:hypothetical protein AB0K80_26745 [Streptomyces sp. NPDC052682]|uniref:hypothetical protein n=1 Tax=Streptomyces sp. NPDC052682 TaxID=3154954 RepID=UPI00344A752B